MTFSIMCLFLTVLWVGLQCMIVAFPGHTHLLIGSTELKAQGELL